MKLEVRMGAFADIHACKSEKITSSKLICFVALLSRLCQGTTCLAQIPGIILKVIKNQSTPLVYEDQQKVNVTGFQSYFTVRFE